MLSTAYHDTSEYPGLAGSSEQRARSLQRYHFARLLADGKRVLEVACGAGLGLGYLARNASQVVGGDIDRLNLAAAKMTYTGAKRVRIVGMDAHSLPFSDASFDLVLLYEALYYLHEPGRFIHEAARALRPGGTLAIAAVNAEWEDLHPAPHAVRYYSARDLCDLVKTCFCEIALYGGFAVPLDRRNELLSSVKKVAVYMGVIPNTLAGRAWIKRIVFGKLSPMPAIVTESMAPYTPPERIPLDQPAPQFKILYLVATRRPGSM
jgi:SAM-dependent methyltransferase